MSKPGSILPALVMLLLVGVAPTQAVDEPPVTIDGVLEGFSAVNGGLPTTGEFLFCTVGDVNGDGFDDIAAAANNNSQQSPVLGLRVYTCRGGTSWEDNSTGLPTVDRYGGIGLGDMDGDGDLDLVAGVEVAEGSTNAGITVWLNNGTVGGRLNWEEGPSPISTGTYMMAITVDVNDDGDLDIVTGTHGRGIRVFTGNGGAGGILQFTEASTGLPNRGDFTGIAVADMNSDQDMDILACDYNGGGPEVHLYTGDGAGSWTDHDSTFPTGTQATMGVTAGDVDNDGNMDIVYGRRDSAVKCLLGNSGGASGTDFCWTAADTGLATVNRYSSVGLADMDIDGDLDLIAACAGQGLQLYLGNGGAGGSMNWSLADAGLPSTDHYYGAAFGDFNKDRVLDVFGSLYHRRGVGGLVAYRGTVTGAAWPTARAVWNGTAVNQTHVVLGGEVRLDGRLSFDAEDAPDGDPTGSSLTYDWNLTRAPTGSVLTEADLVPSDSNAAPSFSPDTVGSYRFTLAVRDSDMHWSVDEAHLELLVLKPNEPPVADAGDDQSVLVGSAVALNGTASYDPDGEVVGWEWAPSASNPAPVNLTEPNGSVTTFIAPEVGGVYAFTLRVQDDNGTWSPEDGVNVTVRLPPNVPPTAVAAAEPAITLGDTIHLNGTGSHDQDGGLTGWEWNCTSHPGLVIDGSDTPEATAVPSRTGTYNFSLRVLDDRGDWSGPAYVSVVVLAPEVNVPPVAVIGGPKLVEAVVNNTIALTAAGSYDADGSIVEYLWNCTDNPEVIVGGQNTPDILFNSTVDGLFEVTLAVRDDNGSWCLQEAMVIITVWFPPPPPPPENQPPVAVISGPLGVVRPSQWVNLSAQGSYDPDGEIAVYEWACVNEPDLELEGQNTSEARFAKDEEGLYTISLRVQDDDGNWSEVVSLVVVIEEENLPPVVELLSPPIGDIAGDEPLTIAWSASDPNGDELEVYVEVMELTMGSSAVLMGWEVEPGDADRIVIDAPLDVLPGDTFLAVRVTVTEVATDEHHSDIAMSEAFRLIGQEPIPNPPDTDHEERMALPYLGIIAAVIVLIIGLVGAFLLRDWMVAQQPSQAAMGRPAHPYQAPPQACPACGRPMSTDNAFGRPYCSHCDMYF